MCCVFSPQMCLCHEELLHNILNHYCYRKGGCDKNSVYKLLYAFVIIQVFLFYKKKKKNSDCSELNLCLHRNTQQFKVKSRWVWAVKSLQDIRYAWCLIFKKAKIFLIEKKVVSHCTFIIHDKRVNRTESGGRTRQTMQNKKAELIQT